jgi:hypothetical protein
MSTKTLPQVRKSSIVIDLQKESEWLHQHWREYVGQWVVLDGDRLVGHGPDPRPIYAQARAEGVEMPLVEFIVDRTQPSMGGWL